MLINENADKHFKIRAEARKSEMHNEKFGLELSYVLTSTIFVADVLEHLRHFPRLMMMMMIVAEPIPSVFQK